MKWMQRNLVALGVAGALSLGLVGPAAAQVQVGDGLVNVQVGNVTVSPNVAIVDAANDVIDLCDLDARVFVAVLARIATVDRTGRERTFCTTEQGDVTVTQSTTN